MNIDSSKEWYDEYCEASPIFASLPAHAIGKGITPLKNQYRCVLNFYSNKKTHWMTLVEDQDLLAREILNNAIKNKNYYNQWFLKWKNETKTYHSLFDKLKKTDLSLLSNKELFALHKKMWKAIIKCRQISMMIDPFIIGSERIMAKELKDYCENNRIKNFNKIYSTLTSPEKESIISQLEFDLIKIAKKFKKDKKLLLLLKKPSEFSKLSIIKKHLHKYCWIKGNWGFGYEYSNKIAISEIRKLIQEDLPELEKEKRNTVFTNRQEKRKLLKRYRFNKTIRTLSDLTVFFSYWHDLRKENALKYIHYETVFAKELSRRFKLKLDDIMMFDVAEIEKMLKNRKKFSIEARKRKKLFLMIHASKRIYFVFGKKAKQYLDKITKIGKQYTGIKGICASAGKGVGKARIIHEVGEFNKFRKGDVLVTGMTRPEFVPLMKKAVAIVTNDGGITCHAAILSRELKKPCIVATRIATHILKDNMLVEVDANRGVVRILKRNN